MPLREITKLNWNSDLIKSVLLDIKKELGDIKYAVGDYGSYLKKGIELSKIKHVHDLIHKIGLTLKKICLRYSDFMSLTMEIKSMRKQFAQTILAYIKPPKLRTKCRYRNVMILSKWGMKTINYLKKRIDKKELHEKLGWLLEHEKIFKEYFLLSGVICKIEKIMKTQGYNQDSKNECEKLLNKLRTKSGKMLKNELLDYFLDISRLLPCEDKILISSDIIESAFGKYKNYVSSNPMAGITNLILCISAFTSTLDENDIQKPLENTTINHVKKWSKEFVGETLLQKRRLAYA